MSPIFRFDSGFPFFLFFSSSPLRPKPGGGTEKSGQPSVIRNPNMDMVVYRVLPQRTHTHTHTHTLVATSLPYREATSAEIFSARIMALSCYLRPRFYRNLVEFQKLRHLTTPRPPFAVMHTLLDINVSR